MNNSAHSPKLNVLFEDNHLLVVEKPAGMPTQEDKTGDESLLTLAKRYLKDTHQKPGNVFLGLVHRLDRPVGGVVVFGKTSKSASRLSEQFRGRDVEKKYLLLVEGVPSQKEGVLEHFIGGGPQNKVRVSATEKVDFKSASLAYVVLNRQHDRYPNASFVEVTLHSGRKHQIRAQWAHIKHPIVGDRKYGSRTNLKPGRIALVAYRLGFAHPIGQKKMVFELPLNSTWPI